MVKEKTLENGGTGFTYDTSKETISTIAGAINSVHDLMGKIIVQKDGSTTTIRPEDLIILEEEYNSNPRAGIFENLSDTEAANLFAKEKECKDLFKQNIKELGYRIDNINKVVRDIYLQIDDIKYNYNLSNEDINKFSLLNKSLKKINKDYKILVDQGKMKTFAYSKLVDELDGLSLKLSRLQDDLDYQLRSITSMKDDETRAREQLNTIEDLLKKSKYRLKDYKIPVIPSSYYIELTEAQDAIREIVKELDKKPIVIKILNIRVDTARDLVFKIYNKTNDMIKIVDMAEKMIVYGNRYRSSYEEIDIALTKAEELFRRGKYKESLDLSTKSISFIDKNIIDSD